MGSEGQRPHRRRQEIDWVYWGSIAGGLFLILLVLVIAAAGRRRETGPAKRKMVPIRANVTYAGSEFTITNNDVFAWTNVVARVNYGVLNPGYTATIEKIGPGESIVVKDTRFTNADGFTLASTGDEAKAFGIWCDTPFGRGMWTAEWK